MALDFSMILLVVHIKDNHIHQKRTVDFKESLPSLRAGRLQSLRITTVLCGAVSDPLSIMICHRGIEVIPGLTGDADMVLAAYINGQLFRCHAPDFHPGYGQCRGLKRRGRFRGQCNGKS